jgi:hypothetical protein
MEFVALANHRKAIRTEIAESSRVFRQAQLSGLARLIETSNASPWLRSPEAVILLLSAVSRFLSTEDAFDLDIGHAAVVEYVEHCIREIEGERSDDRVR